ncbi:helix-turn-helix protein [Actinocorallia herbida]|uniref:Helix-turn-helix protein n=1 Tax=Actinocorallia herbida TaxID=58109 RepID=A0A3N1CQW3_9ACTN|nr:helix-turn-helix transcriptional regulator [Actinocorallia herbida]ROO83700.1 helix-turn-helix protein [Actinocorallia herbida]
MTEARRCGGCGVSLSRYNPEPVCGACARARRCSAEPWVFDTLEIREVLAGLDLAALVVTIREATGMSQQELAELVPGWTQTKVGRIERGERDSLFDVRELLGFADAIGMPREALLPLLLGEPSATEGVRGRMREAEADVDRRTFTRSTAVLSAGLVLPGAAVAPPARATGAHLRHLRAALDGLWAKDRMVGGGGLLHQAVALFVRCRAMLDDSDYSEQVGRGLLSLCAELGNCAGFLAFDAGDHQLARRLFSEAALMAESSDDGMVTAQVYASMALHSIHLCRKTHERGHAREALRLLDRAGTSARHVPSAKLHALIEVRRAPAAALLGDTDRAVRSIGKARDELERDTHYAEPECLGFVTHAEITGFEAGAFRDLGKVGPAVRCYEHVLADPTLHDRNRANYVAGLADVLHEAGDTGSAHDFALTVLPALEGGISSKRTLDRLANLRAATTDEELAARFDALSVAFRTG